MFRNDRNMTDFWKIWSYKLGTITKSKPCSHQPGEIRLNLTVKTDRLIHLKTCPYISNCNMQNLFILPSVIFIFWEISIMEKCKPLQTNNTNKQQNVGIDASLMLPYAIFFTLLFTL